MAEMDNVRVRFAPSPSGFLHVGSARCALFNFLFVKKHKGTFVLRMEDTDEQRSRPEFEEDILQGLRWLGILWDEGPDSGGAFGPYKQSQRLGVYRDFYKKLAEQNLTYPCFCTEEELELKRKLALKSGFPPKYDGRCRNLSQREQDEYKAQGRKAAIRFKIPTESQNGDGLRFKDMIHGEMSFKLSLIGDFIITRSDGTPTFLFSGVADDHLMHITHVIRGDDHLSNTPRQILLQRALNLDIPVYAHIPMILARDRSKLSKRHGAVAVAEFRSMGFLPEAMVNYLCFLGWTPPDASREIFSMEELAEDFSLERVSKSGAIFDTGKLRWMNAQYIRKKDPDALGRDALPFLEKEGCLNKHDAEEKWDWFVMVLQTMADTVETLSEFPATCSLFFEKELPPLSEEARGELADSRVQNVLRSVCQRLLEMSEWTPASIKEALQETARNLSVSPKEVFHPVRLALTGRNKGPELHKLISLLSREEIRKRMRASAG